MSDHVSKITRRDLLKGVAAAAASSFAERVGAAVPARPPFTLVYLAIPGCGEMHNYANLRAADNLPNVTLRHVNVFNPTQAFAGAPGIPMKFQNVAAVMNAFQRYGMEITDATKVLLLDANNRPVRQFPTSNNKNGVNFLQEVRRATGNLPAQQQQRGAARG